MAGQPHVVVVDDDSSILAMLSTALRAGAAARVSAFTSAEEALRAFDGLGAVGLVLTDYSMPDLDGLALATRLRARYPALPIVLLSAVEVNDAPPGVLTRALVKPCPPRVLLPLVRQLLFLQDVAPPAQSPPGRPSRLAELTVVYRAHLARVHGSLGPLVAAAGSPEGERALRDQLHQLAGTAGSYGFGEVTDAAVALRAAVVARSPLEVPAARLADVLATAARGP